MVNQAPILQDLLTALPHGLAQTLTRLLHERAQRPSAPRDSSPDALTQQTLAQVTLAFVTEERRTHQVARYLETGAPRSSSAVKQAVQAAFSTPVLMQAAAAIAGPLTGFIVPRCIEALTSELAQREQMAFDRWLFEQQRALEERLAQEGRDEQLEVARYQRASLMTSTSLPLTRTSETAHSESTQLPGGTTMALQAGCGKV